MKLPRHPDAPPLQTQPRGTMQCSEEWLQQNSESTTVTQDSRSLRTLLRGGWTHQTPPAPPTPAVGSVQALAGRNRDTVRPRAPSRNGSQHRSRAHAAAATQEGVIHGRGGEQPRSHCRGSRLRRHGQRQWHARRQKQNWPGAPSCVSFRRARAGKGGAS